MYWAKTRSQKDRWCLPRPLMLESLSLLYLTRDKEVKVVDYWVPIGEGGVQIVDLCKRVNDWELDDITNLHGTADPAEVEDCMHWIHAKKGIFSAKSYREAPCSEVMPDPIWLNIQKLKIPSKVAFFMWTIAKSHFPTIDFLQCRGMVIPNVCFLCLQEAESIDHMFIHCPFASEIQVFLKTIGLPCHPWVLQNRMDMLIIP